MKKLFIFLPLLFLFACKKDYRSIYNYVDATNNAYVKLVHAVPNALATPTSSTQAGLQVYLGNAKITGANVTYGGGVYPGLEYALVPSGNLSLKAVIPAGTSNPEIAVVNAPVTLTAGKFYTAVITDTIPTASFFLIEENFSPLADSGKYFVRLVNATPKSGAYDLYGVTDLATIASNIQYKSASAFTQIFVGTGSRTFAIRKPGTTTNIATVAITPTPGRMYSILSYGIDGATGLRAPKVTFFTSRFQSPQ